MKTLHNLILATMCIGLAGCATPQQEPKAPIYVKACGTLRAFNPDKQKALAAQLAAVMKAQPDSPIIEMGDDWVRMRDQIRACLKK